MKEIIENAALKCLLPIINKLSKWEQMDIPQNIIKQQLHEDISSISDCCSRFLRELYNIYILEDDKSIESVFNKFLDRVYGDEKDLVIEHIINGL